MNIKSVLTGFLLLCFCTASFGQKVKYKDLMVLLSARQYDQAEPFLKKYLRDNNDNPNAYLYMGLICQERAGKLDPLKQTDQLMSLIDSTVYFLGKANAGMTEKEVSKNEENYQLYSRRDYRTGKFGVKLSDVKLDIETRMKIKDKIPLLKALKKQFMESQRYYESARKLFLKVQDKYPGEKELYLRANDSLILSLENISRKYDSCHINFNDYRSTSRDYGRTGYNQDLDPQEIKDFKRDGKTEVDFYKDNISLWDYKRWALGTMDIIEKEVKPLTDLLVSHDREISTLQMKVKQDSVPVRQQIKALQTKKYPYLTKLDPHAFPLKVFEMKEAELIYGSQVAEDKPARDSANIIRQVKVLKHELQLARKVDSLGTSLQERNMGEDMLNYGTFVTAAYGTREVLSSQISATKEFGSREVRIREAQLNAKTAALKWLINGADSIPITSDAPATSRFKTMVQVDEVFTSGLQYKDSLATGYFYSITASRKPEIKASYPVDQQVFKKRNLPFTKALSAQDQNGQIFFVLYYSEAKIKDKYPATLVKIYRTDGHAWSVNYAFTQLPSEISYTADMSELLVKTKNAAGELIAVTFDKNGKEIKQ